MRASTLVSVFVALIAIMIGSSVAVFGGVALSTGQHVPLAALTASSDGLGGLIRSRPDVARVLAFESARHGAPRYSLYEANGVSQAEAEILFDLADAAVYFPAENRVCLLTTGENERRLAAPTSSGALGSGTPRLARGQAASLVAERVRRVRDSGLGDFAKLLEVEIGKPQAESQPEYLVKFPSVAERRGGPPAPVVKSEISAAATDYYIYENFEGDVWANWQRWDNTGGQYTWGIRSCDSQSGSYSADAVRGGQQGMLLSCGSGYPQSVKTRMYATRCITIPSDWQAWLELYLKARITRSGTNEFAVLAADSRGALWGWSFWGNWGGTSVGVYWFRLVFNLRQWYGLGDLGKNDCNTLYLQFQSDTATAAGFGARVDDLTIWYGPTAGHYRCSVIADPMSGSAPLTVAFRGACDYSAANFYWDFNDGTTSKEKDPIHVFTSPGTYYIDFAAWDNYYYVETHSSVKVTVAPGVPCTFSISPGSQSFSSAGGSGTIGVTASAPSCAWTASASAGWITITGGSSGTGNGTVAYSVAANTSAARSGMITIAGQVFTVNQDALVCSYSLTPASSSFAAAGGTSNFLVATNPGCAWNASTSATWIHLTSSSGTGNGSVAFTVDANASGLRSGAITVGDQTHLVTQVALDCSYSLQRTSATFEAAGGGGNFPISTAAGCPWSAGTAASWIHITVGSGTGSGYVYYSVDVNPGPARSGSITAGGQTFTITQSAGTVSLPYSRWLSAVAHVDVPATGAYWRSDVAVLNRTGTTATLELRVYTGGGMLTMPSSVGPNAQVLFKDVAALLGLTNGSAAFEVRSSADIFLSGRTYNQVAFDTTYGQDYDGVDPSTLLGAGQSAYLTQLTQNAYYRSNIGVTNAGTGTASVTVTIYDGASGAQLWTDTRSYDPGGFYQYNQPLKSIGSDNAYAKVTVNSGSGVFSYLSVIDQKTNDATTVVMKR